MNAEEIESLLRKARPPELPPGWKRQILCAASKPEGRPVVMRLTWSALAACWGLIVLLHLMTPDVAPGIMPFDCAAFFARKARVERLLASGELDPPTVEPLRIESIFRLPAPKKSPAT